MKEVWLTQEAVYYAKERDARVEVIQQAKMQGEDYVEIEKLTTFPRLLYDGSDLTAAENDWTKISMSRYYDIQIELKH